MALRDDIIAAIAGPVAKTAKTVRTAKKMLNPISDAEALLIGEAGATEAERAKLKDARARHASILNAMKHGYIAEGEARSQIEQLYNETGWFPMGERWSMEIQDPKTPVNVAQLNALRKQKPAFNLDDPRTTTASVNKTHLGLIASHPELMRRYKQTDDSTGESFPIFQGQPIIVNEDMGDTSGIFRPFSGKAYRAGNPLTGAISISPKEKAVQSTFMHELQHSVDNEEDSAAGRSGDRTSFASDDAGAYGKYLNEADELRGRVAEQRYGLTPEQRKAYPAWAHSADESKRAAAEGAGLVPTPTELESFGGWNGGIPVDKKQAIINSLRSNATK